MRSIIKNDRPAWLFLTGLIIFTWSIESSQAAEVYLPPDTCKAQLQTNGPWTELNNGDWWTNHYGGLQSHVYLIYVPKTVPLLFTVHLDLWDPECYRTGSELDQQRGDKWDETSFRLLAPDGYTVIVDSTFLPTKETSERWIDFQEFTPQQYGYGIYKLFVSTAEDDENSYRLRLHNSDPDDNADSGDELNLAISKSSLQFTANGCIDLSFYVAQTSEIRLANFDFENEGSISYRQPSGEILPGTVSGETIWNNTESSALPPPGGDVISSPQIGWWTAHICVPAANQFIFYPGVPYHIFQQPSYPQLTVTIDDGVDQTERSQHLEYDIKINNEGEGAAQNIFVTVTLSAGLQVITMSSSGAFLDPNQVIFQIPSLLAGESRTFKLGTFVSETSPAPVVTTAQAAFQDMLFSNYLSSQAIDSDLLAVQGSISGLLWQDNNESGSPDPGEPGLSNLRIFLVNASPETLATAYTDNSGLYRFEMVPIGDYNVIVDAGLLPEDWAPTTGGWQQSLIITDQGENHENINFGFHDMETPVELSHFSAEAKSGSIFLNWTTQSESENVGFNIYRSETENGEYVRINQRVIPGAGTSQSLHSYSFNDQDIAAGKTFYYKLSDIDFTGVETMHGPVTATALQQPISYVLEQNYPNPFNGETIIPFQLKENGTVKLIIYNLLGQEMRRLVDEEMQAGRHLIHWEGRDQIGQNVPAGIYFYQLIVNDFKQMRKMQIIK